MNILSKKESQSYQASTRNKQIAEAFYLTHDIEKYGSGFIRIRRAITNYPTMKFEFREFGDGFVSEFNYVEQKISTKGDKIVKKKNVTEKVGEKITSNQQLILDCIAENPRITIADLSLIIGISDRKIEANLQKLKSKGLIERVGADKGGHWRVV